MKTTFIYALKEPETGEIRYVGKSNDPKKRLEDHMSCQGNHHRACWVKNLKHRGLRPILEVIDEIPLEYWRQLEVAYISFYREQGCDLVNGTLGGDGLQDPTPEVRKKMSESKAGKNHPLYGTKASPETRKKMSEARLGEKHHFYGIKRSQEERDQQSRNLSPESRKKLSEYKLSLGNEKFLKICELRKLGKSQYEIAEYLGVSQSSISQFLSRRRNLRHS